MITNARQYRITKAQADKFAATIRRATKSPPAPGTHPILHKASIDGMRAQLADLRRELKLYDGLKTARGRATFRGRLDELTLLLAQARIARDWSQRELAERLAVTMQQVQSDEAGGYARASLERINRVCQALGAQTTLQLKLVPFSKTAPR